ncbi:nuclear hormone receptor HR96 [Contarinia nasturtii]|uniref:nuclear hormone receptor HR96 n=1 Tax=Contarinia nasturtii TaxID=265458 RepID=UPI0012D387C1|nr:nuclear hormone receptor HR96 [Contarinia nasturtii]
MSQMDKVCMVCGDKALGYNFNAVTCESCKAFFRRNALSSKDFSCPFDESCAITVVTRRFCQRCRLQKCFKIGMRKEYIMTDEDKLLKRKKIEQNRVKRKSKALKSDDDKIKTNDTDSQNDFWTQEHMMDTGQMDLSPGSSSSDCLHAFQSIPSVLSNSSMSPTISSVAYPTQILQPQSPMQPISYQTEIPPPINTVLSNNSPSAITNTISSTTNNNYHMDFQPTQTRLEYPSKDSNTSDIVNFFLNHPTESSNYINQLMPNQKYAMEVVTKIIQSQRDAMRMIGYLIGAPGDALKIISKIMNSPYHALTVFTKFITSPTDALEIIAKCVNSPSDVLQFIQQLMNTPDNASEIVNKFMNAPAEAMKMLNEMVDITMVDSTTKMDSNDLTHLTVSNEATATTTNSDARQMEFQTNDIVTDTLQHTKTMSSPIVRNLLQSMYGESSHCGHSKTIPTSSNAIETGVIRSNAHSNTLESIINDAIKIEYNLNVHGKESNINRELNDNETAKLNELIVAYKALFIPLDEDITPLVRERNKSTAKTEKNPEDPKLVTLINLTATAIKRLIKVVKKISAFKSMCQEDQVALLKGGCTDMMILRSMMQYDVDHCIWNIPHSKEIMSSIKSDVLKLASNNVYEEYENFIRTFEPRLRKDENIILIMSAIVLFTPTRAKTVHADVIILEQNSYYYLLRRYLESIYTGCEAKSLFLKLIQKIKELECLKDAMIAVYLDVNPNRVEPLLREIFDIKN